MGAVLRSVGVAEGDDASFGPQLWSQFDFTLLFEHTILTILPAGLLLATSPFYLYRYSRAPVYIPSSSLLWFKVAIAAALLGVEIGGLTQWASLLDYRSETSLAAATLACISAIYIVVAVSLEHRHAFGSSAFISLYLGITLLFDVAKSRSCFLRPHLYVAGVTSAITAALKLVLLLSEEISKRNHISNPTLRSSLSRERLTGFWNRSLFLWLNSTFLFGFRNRLHVDDLDILDYSFSSEYLSSKFKPYWDNYKSSSRPLIQALFLTLKWSFLVVIIPRLMYIGFLFCQPFLLRRVLAYLGEETQSIEIRNGLICATIVIYAGKALTKASYTHMNYRLVTRARGVLVSEILEQTLLIDHVQAMEFAAATLMSTDVDGIATGIPQFHEIWASSVEAIVGVVILAKMIGAATCLIVFPGLIMTITSTITGKRMAPSRAAWNKQVESRVATTSIILRQIQGIRMTGLAPFATDLLQGLRVSEMKYSIKFRQLWVCLRAFVMLCGHMTPMIIVAAALFWTKFTNGIDAVEIFAALAFIFNTSQAMIRIMVAYPGFRSIMGCLHRIQTYLLLPRRLDGRETISDLVLRNCESTISEKDASKSLSPPERKPRIELQLPQPPVVLIDVSVAPTVTDAAILNNVNISVARSEIAAVVGHTGSGKSTLLKAIIGEAHVFEGLVYVEQRSIAFCDQSSWLRNVSMKENIIGQSNYDEDWYNVVIEACLLSDDIQQLPNGDETMVGNGGSSLSGGQRQRVALARAIYCQTPILVLDNVFSALDEASADSIFDGLFGSLGLLRRINSTVIMTTHSVKYLQMVDQLIVINEDGSVKTVPNSIKEVANKSQIRNMMVDTSSTEDREQTRRDEGPGKEIGIDCLRTERVELLRRRGDLGLYRYYFTSVAKWLWLVWFVSMIFTTLSEKFPEIFIRIWSERGPTNNLYLVGYMLLGLCNFISSAMSLSLYYFMIVPKSAENLHRKLLDAVMKSTTRFISYTNSGSILNLFSQDMSLLCQELPFSFFLFILSSLMILIDLGIIASGATYAPFVIPGVFLALYAIQHFYLRTSRQLRHVDLETKTPLYSYFTEATAGLMHIRSYGWGTKFLADSRVLLDRSQRPFYSMYCIQRWLGLVLDLCVLGVATILVSVAVCIRHSTSPSALGLAMLNIIQFGDTLGSLLAQWINLETSLGAIARIREFTQNTPFEPETVTNDSLPSTCLRPGSIQLTNVSSTYDSDGSNPALRGVSLDIKAGQKAIVIGRTGCGKSSLILTMLNFLDYTGSIKVDDVDLSQIPRQVLRSCITTIPQDLVELPGTIRQNVIPTRQDASDDAIVTQALDDVGLISYINTRGGIDADLKTMGFSHGQKQLLGIARALLHHKKYDSRILFVDEATSGMDNATADKIDRLLAEVFAGCTVVSISHRVGQATHADLVVEISDGQIVSLREI